MKLNPPPHEGSIERKVVRAPSWLAIYLPILIAVAHTVIAIYVSGLSALFPRAAACPEGYPSGLQVGLDIEGTHLSDHDSPPLDPGSSYPSLGGGIEMRASKLNLRRDGESVEQVRPPWDGFEVHSDNPGEWRDRSHEISPPMRVDCRQVGERQYSTLVCDCLLEPNWLDQQGFLNDQGEVIVVYRSPGSLVNYPCGNGMYRYFHEEDYRYIVAWGTPPDWNHVILDGEASHSPNVRHRGNEIRLCLPQGFYVVNTLNGRKSGLESWPRRLRLAGALHPSFVVATTMFAILVFWIIVFRFLRSRTLTSKLENSHIQDATVTDLTDDGLTVSTRENETLTIPWVQLLDTFRDNKSVCLAWSDEGANIDAPQSNFFRTSWERGSMEPGQRISLVLEKSIKTGAPYRSGHSSPESLAWLLHDDVTLSELQRTIVRCSASHWSSWLIMFMSLIASSASLIWSLGANPTV